MLRTLIFGGTFNPVHVGHVRAAIEVAEALDLVRVEWIPGYAPRHKADSALLRFQLRVALLHAALSEDDRFSVNEIEKDLPVPSFTIQTLEAMAEAGRESDRYFLLGDREFLRLHKWRAGRRVAELVHIAIVCRTEFDIHEFALDVAAAWPESRRIDPPAGSVMAFELIPGRRAVLLPLPRIDISSSLVRRRWLERRDLSYLVPRAAIDILEQHRAEVDAAWRDADASVSN
ncbi:nicotinate (nicotinamide) nucleotide adenylyltransferase [Pseudorhodoplanes sp.]|uniref:nicotinate (nicotinamide) nucleotide adenylyltransferase n=1 Tax=Pseudorhodoplanes sp. TaxID=1934341 RepID=UPI00391951C0